MPSPLKKVLEEKAEKREDDMRWFYLKCTGYIIKSIWIMIFWKHYKDKFK